MEPTSARVVATLSRALESYDFGRLILPSPNCAPGVGRARSPDVALRTCFQAGGSGVIDAAMPELVIYVITPTDLAADIACALKRWLDAGVPQVWEVYPNTRTVRTWRADRTADQFCRDDTLRAADLLPGFTLPLADLFATTGDPPPVQ